MMYYASLGVAYGLKEFKWFVWFTPPYSGAGEHFITGILDSEGKKSALFDGVTAVNRCLDAQPVSCEHRFCRCLSHGRQKREQTALPTFALNTTGSYVVSVMRDRTDGQEYLVVVNKSFRKEMTADFTVVGNSLDLSAVTDITSGTPTALKKNGNGFSLSLKAGGLAVLKFPQGYSVLPAADQKTARIFSKIAVPRYHLLQVTADTPICSMTAIAPQTSRRRKNRQAGFSMTCIPCAPSTVWIFTPPAVKRSDSSSPRHFLSGYPRMEKSSKGRGVRRY